MQVMKELSEQRIIPVLKIEDLPTSRNFYEDFLGFTLNWSDRPCSCFPAYAELEFKGSVVHLTEQPGHAVSGTAVLFRVDDLIEYRNTLLTSTYIHEVPEIEEGFSGKIMIIEDPSGNRLGFWER